MKRSFALTVAACLVTLTASACTTAGTSQAAPDTQADSARPNGTLRISAAASLQGAFAEITGAFEIDNPEISVDSINFDGSATLVEQILGGDTVDVFASADQTNMDKLAAEDGTATPATIFASNQIVLGVPADSEKIRNFTDVADPAFAIAVCASEVPCGAAAERLLEREQIDISPVTYEQSVSAVAAKIAAGEVDGGFIYQTDAIASGGKIVPLDTPQSAPNLYAAAAIREGNEEAASRFIAYLRSEPAQAILKEYGFGPP